MPKTPLVAPTHPGVYQVSYHAGQVIYCYSRGHYGDRVRVVREGPRDVRTGYGTWYVVPVDYIGKEYRVTWPNLSPVKR